MLQALCLALLVASTPSGVAANRERVLHPEDGPDIDLRIGIEDDAVRVRMTMNIAFVWELVEFDWDRPPRFSPGEEVALRDKLVEYYRAANHVRVSGIDVAPVLESFAVVELDHEPAEGSGARGVLSTVGVQLGFDYSLKSAPAEILLGWGAYVPDFQKATPDDVPPKDVPCQVTALGRTFLHVFTQGDPELSWTAPSISRAERFQAVPTLAAEPVSGLRAWHLLAAAALVSGILAFPRRQRARFALGAAVLAAGAVAANSLDSSAAPVLDEELARATFAPLHANIYRAFDYASESDVYDALAHSVRGDLLDQLYGEIYRGLVMQEQGGAVSRVQAVRPLATDVLEVGRLGDEQLPSFRVDALWQVDGSVFHWGHSHNRTNEYRAHYTVVLGAEGWRIASAETLEQRRLLAAAGTSGDVEVTRESLEEAAR